LFFTSFSLNNFIYSLSPLVYFRVLHTNGIAPGTFHLIESRGVLLFWIDTNATIASKATVSATSSISKPRADLAPFFFLYFTTNYFGGKIWHDLALLFASFVVSLHFPYHIFHSQDIDQA
jgi:hypothetical protein